MRHRMLAVVAAAALFAVGGCGSGGDVGDTGPGGGGGASVAAAGGMAGSGGGACGDTELCDGIDNNCDGSVDEGCSCIEGDTQACYSGDPATQDVGECIAGQQTCDTQGAWGACEGEVVPDAEQCDGLDNDCNGEIDETFGTVTCGLGICQMTVDECVAGIPQPCIPGNPNANGETCEGTDDDCDGTVDEGCNCINTDTQPCYSGSPATQNVGECHDGTQTCVAGQWAACIGDATPTAELCDNLDNDCDGMPDDGDPEGGGVCATNLPGICNVGTEHCQNGSIVCQQNNQATAETCDGLDNDCDGTVDDGNPGGGGSCVTGQQGVCSAGTQQCVGGVIICVPNTQAGPETCDGLDNDCDGSVDDGNPGGGSACSTGQQGVCADGTTLCQGGMLQCSQTQTASAEVCDGLDNDCDGNVDNGNPGGGNSCNTGGLGVCIAGTTACQSGSIVCNQNQAASTEVCDGLDNDCDGNTDEGDPGGGGACSTAQPGICDAGTLHCVNAALTCQQNQMAGSEVCDGLDNDCDGSVDDGNPGGGASCSTGQLGECSAGTTQCSGGGLVCNPINAPAAEICDTLDNDCDGTVDEGCNCVNGQTQSCYSGPNGTQGVGICQGGIQTCSSGQWGPCVGEVTPGAEQCDGIDNDCDTLIDNGNPGGGMSCNAGQPGVCAAGTTDCQMGSIVCVQNTMPSPEVCDGLDNDCNGTVDDSNPGGGMSCDTGQLGICQAGTTQCQGGALNCVQNTSAGAEVCDGLDNDCDGVADEGDPGGGGACTTGQLGVCGAGTLHCVGGAIVCQQNTSASAEVCDGLDNDCDGSVDDGNPGGGMSCSTGQLGVCATGTTQCSGGSVVCNANNSPSAEVCDGLDNDCDGSTDENNPGGGQGCDTGNLGVCQAGTTQCSSGALVCNQDTAASAEVCDGLDNDCDGSTDENNPGGGQTCSTGQQGICNAGTTSCSAGTLVCNQNNSPSAEVCDGLDNNCDGFVDENNPGGGGGCNTGQQGVCQFGTLQCISSALSCVANNSPSAEVCGDMLDNDCDGFVDNGCGGCGGGTFDCDASSSNGCECTVGTGCCGGSCQTQHDAGFGGHYYDCVAQSTYNSTQAMKACEAEDGSGNCIATTCGGYGVVCSTGADNCRCWNYAGPAVGYAYDGNGKQCWCTTVPGPNPWN